MRLRINSVFCFIKFIVILVILLNSCQKEAEIAIGANFEGGIIFYMDNTGEHGLVAAPKDQGYQYFTEYQWGCVTNAISGANGSLIGTGNQNTIDIINGCPETNTAAYICSNLELNGYSDWYLPSKDELNLLYNNLKIKNLGSFRSTAPIFTEYDAFYWSSTKFESSVAGREILSAWWQNFKTGGQDAGSSRNNSAYVRAIRGV